MFKQRLITSLILAPLAIGLIIYANSWIFLLLMACLLFGMAYEWQQFVLLEAYKNKWFKTFLIFAGGVLVAKLANIFLYLDVLFWIIAAFLIIKYPKHSTCWFNSGFVSLVGWILLGVLVSILYEWQATEIGVKLIFCVLFIVWSADIGAYLAGRKWGKNKMIPQVSPGKSWEGLLGGLSLALMVAYLESFYFEDLALISWLIVSLITAIASVFGDLWMSALKRQVNLKDTGHLIPGHGGLLDRLDSLLAAVPVFYLGLKLLG